MHAEDAENKTVHEPGKLTSQILLLSLLVPQL